MADAIDRSESWRKLRSTPLRDVLRGRITGRLDWTGQIRRANLPSSVSQLIYRVVRRTRLWRLEKAAVADELIAHFQDGLDAGASAEELVKSFGDPRRTARLIRRAKLRARSVPLRALRLLNWTIIWLLAGYALLTLRFFVGRPHPTVDYLAILNAKTLQTPDDQRAWPIYRQAILLLSDRSNQQQPWPKLIGYNVYGKHWPEIAAWLRAHSSALALARSASTRPSFGFVLGPGGSQNDPAMGWNYTEPSKTAVNPGSSANVLDDALFTVLLPYLQEMRGLALAVSEDTKLAAEQHDPDRAAADVMTLFSIADQLHQQKRFLVDELVSISIRAEAMAAAEHVLVDQASLWSDAQLTQLAHRLAIYQKPADLIDFGGERFFIPDVLQRTFTEGGLGGGRLSYPGAFALISLGQNSNGALTIPFIYPLVMEATLSRGDLQRIASDLMDQYQAALQVPLRDSVKTDRALDQQMWRWHTSWISSLRYYPLTVLMPSLSHLASGAEIQLGHRDGLTVAIALELFHRQHGSYPSSLQQLVPQLLPSVPADRITGDPLHFHLANGNPLVYSVGADRHDDGGRIIGKHATSNSAAQWGIAGDDEPKGDWILFPHPHDTTMDPE